MLQYRTDLAMEAHELLCARSRAQTLSGVDRRTVYRSGCSVTSVRIDTEGAARQLGKPRGRYVTLDLSPLQKNADDMLERASRAVGAELRALLGENVKSVLVAGLGNANMTPDAIGPRSAEHVLVTRHLRQNGAFSAFCSVSVLTPGVLGRTGIEAMETLRGIEGIGIVEFDRRDIVRHHLVKYIVEAFDRRDRLAEEAEGRHSDRGGHEEPKRGEGRDADSKRDRDAAQDVAADKG